jgi:hypothetical protein
MSMSLQIDYPTTYPRGYSGQLVGAIEDCDIIPVINREASASIAFGRAVVFKTSSPTTDLDALLPATQNDIVAGIVIHFHQYPRVFTTTDINGATVTVGQLDGTGLIPGTMMAVLRRGKILVTVEDGCAVGDRLFVRAVAAGDPEFLGGLNNAADSTDMIDCTKQGVFMSSTTAGGLAELWVDFVNKP